MTIPNTFANVSQLDTPDLDENFNFLGALVIIPCTESGTNTILLTTSASLAPAVTTYTNYSPIFSFIAAASATAAVTVNINGIGAKNLYKGNGLVAAGSGDIIVGGMYWIAYNSALNSGNGGFVIGNPSTANSEPTVQRLTATSGTYTPPAGLKRVWVRMVGPGGGGAGATANNGATPASNTTFGDWTAVPGSGGGAGGGLGGAGGTGGTNGTGTLIDRVAGGGGGAGGLSATAGVDPAGGQGGSNPRGGGGRAGRPLAGGNNAGTNSGGGGGGGGANSGTNSGGGGGAGEYVEFFMTATQIGASLSYAVIAGGAGGSAGTNAGGNGADGIIIVVEYYF